MNTLTPLAPAGTAKKRRIGPVLTLAFLAPFIAEVLSGATRISVIIALVPEMMVWGGGALLARELVRRWGGRWPSLLMLGLALSVAEEFIIQQTSLAPLPFPGALGGYGRMWGVNWIYFLFMLGYESVWVVLVPVQVTELLFPERRNDSWLRKWGIVRACWLFMVGSFMAYFGWVKRARIMILHMAPYQPRWTTLFAGVWTILLLAATAYLLRRTGHEAPGRAAPWAWVVGIVVLAMGFPWYWLMKLQFSPSSASHPPFWIPIAVCVAWAGVAYLLFRRWTSTSAWSDLHGWAAAFAATMVCMVAGFLGSGSWSRVDLVGKIILNVAAVVGFFLILKRIRQSRLTITY
jgi:hypothetical protein